MVNTREESAITQEQIQAYWEMVLFQLQQESPLVVQLLSGQSPTWNQKKIHFIVQMKLLNLMSMKITSKKIQQYFENFGFPKMGVDIIVNDELGTQLEEELRIKHETIEQEYQEKVVQQKEVQETAASKPASVNSDSSILYGKAIRSNLETREIADIYEEERNVLD